MSATPGQTEPETAPLSHPGGHAGGGWKLALSALGVVYGDIGTSPLYTMKECFLGDHGVPPTPDNVMGILSLLFWALTLTVSIKYLTFILRADNHGEGGILALLALVPRPADRRASPGLLVLLVLFGAAMLYGDGVITPAISVLSAIEGLEVATTALKPAVVPLTVATLLGLFLLQKRGTARIGGLFGPITLTWFIMIATFGALEVARHPQVIASVDPRYAARFFLANGPHGFLVLGGVVLAITGAEALYADMGHFGAKPIRRTWFALVLPALLLNYWGQGALLLRHPEQASNLFFALVPPQALYFVVVVATAAAVVASQALISGVYSLTQQAVQLGFFPRVTIIHTSKETEGQIYVPEVNTALLVCCIGLVLIFKNSSALAAAYGIAVTGTMAITTIVYYAVITRTWRWPVSRALPLAGAFLLIDLSFFSATATKFLDGGWVPALLSLGVYTVMTTWSAGRLRLANQLAEAMIPLGSFLEDLSSTRPVRVPGTAVFMAANPNGVPPVLLHHFKHNRCLHEQVILLTVVGAHIPEVSRADSIEVLRLGEGFSRVTVHYGFTQQPNVPLALSRCAEKGLHIDAGSTSYYLGRETLLPTKTGPMWHWRKALFAFISRNSVPATAYFGLPPSRVVEMGMQIDF